MTRKIVSEQELVSWINSQFKKTESCDSVTISGVYKLKNPEENNGCNWSSSSYRTGGSPKEICNDIVSGIFSEASEAFNVAWPHQK